MAKSPFTTGSTIKVDSIVIDASSPLDNEILVYDGTQFITDSPVPIGTIEMWGGNSGSVPGGWTICDGGQVLATTALGLVLSTRYNTGGEMAGYVRIPNMSSVVPVGIASGGAGGTTTTTYSDANVAHSHASFTGSVANTNASGNDHSHTFTAGGAHSHYTTTENNDHTHQTNSTSNNHFHYTNGANIAYINTGPTAHVSNQHGNIGADGGLHSHNTGTESVNHAHSILSGNMSNVASHNHAWALTATSSAGINAPGSHTHAVNLVSIYFIIKY
jgi:hypothetical protein